MQKISKKWFVVCISCLLIALIVAACAQQQQATLAPSPAPASSQPAVPTPKYGGTLRFADQSNLTAPGYPPLLIGVPPNRLACPAIERLFNVDKTGNPVPFLATSEKSDFAAKTVTLALQKGVKFHDGTDFNAAAVKWNLENAKAEKQQGTDRIKSVDVVDDYTVRINLTEWDSSLVSNLAMQMGMIISPTAFKTNGKDWCIWHPLGTGPFKLDSVTKDVSVKYTKFAEYWQKGKPYLDGIEYNLVADAITRELSFRGGEADVLATMDSTTAANVKQEKNLVATTVIMGSGTAGFMFDSANPKSPFYDVRVRQAFTYAIDSPKIITEIAKGMLGITNQWVAKGHWAYNPDVVGYSYNPDKAKQLLAEAGYANGFKTKLGYTATPDITLMVTACQNYLKAVGIEAVQDPMTSAKRYQVTGAGGTWEGAIFTGTNPNPDASGTLAWIFTSGVQFTQSMTPDDVRAAITKAVSASDFETRKKYTFEAEKLIFDKYCLVQPLYINAHSIVMYPYVKGTELDMTPDAGNWRPENAWIDKK